MVDFKQMKARSDAASSVIRREHPGYDQWEKHAFSMGFSAGSRHYHERSGLSASAIERMAVESMRSEDTYYNDKQKKAYLAGFKSGISWKYEPDRVQERIPEDIERLVHLYVPEDARELVFFRVTSPIKESETGRHAHEVMGNTSKIDADVYSMGIAIDKAHGIHRVFYEHDSRPHDSYTTILGRDLKDLSQTELSGIYDRLLEDLSKKGRLIPAPITEVYDPEGFLSEEEGYLFEVAIDHPYDEEQQDMADRYGCETMDQDDNRVLFADFDDAIRFAYEDIRLLESRGDHRREVGEDGHITFHVTFESSNTQLVGLANLHHGDADVATIGTPLIRSYFGNLKDAKAFRDDVRNLEERAVNAVVERTCDPRTKAMTDVQRAYVGAYLMNDGAKTLKDAAPVLQKLLDKCEENEKYHLTNSVWKGNTLCELTDFLNGKVRENQAASLHR